MANIIFDRPRSLNPEALVRELRTSRHCQGMDILIWPDEITIADDRTGVEVRIAIAPSKLEVESGAGKKALAEKVADALVAQGLRRRPPPGSGRAKKGPRPQAPPPERP